MFFIIRSFSTSDLPEATESAEVDNREGNDAPPKGLPRSQSERLLAVCKEHVLQERELQEKYHESMFGTLDKVMKESQATQLKTLNALYQREKNEVTRKLQTMRQEEVCWIFFLIS